MDVPPGQVPRDAAFWATYHAVETEHNRRLVKLRCEMEGHDILVGEGCQRCLAPMDQVMRDEGYVSEGGQWVKRA